MQHCKINCCRLVYLTTHHAVFPFKTESKSLTTNYFMDFLMSNYSLIVQSNGRSSLQQIFFNTINFINQNSNVLTFLRLTVSVKISLNNKHFYDFSKKKVIWLYFRKSGENIFYGDPFGPGMLDGYQITFPFQRHPRLNYDTFLSIASTRVSFFFFFGFRHISVKLVLVGHVPSIGDGTNLVQFGIMPSFMPGYLRCFAWIGHHTLPTTLRFELFDQSKTINNQF